MRDHSVNTRAPTPGGRRNAAPRRPAKTSTLDLALINVFLFCSFLFESRLYLALNSTLQPVLLAVLSLFVLGSACWLVIRGVNFAPFVLVAAFALIVYQLYVFKANTHADTLNFNSIFQFVGPLTFVFFYLLIMNGSIGTALSLFRKYAIVYVVIYIVFSLVVLTGKIPLDNIRAILANDVERGDRLFLYGIAAAFAYFCALADLKRLVTLEAVARLLVCVAAMILSLSRVYFICLLLISVLFLFNARRSVIAWTSFLLFFAIASLSIYGAIDPHWNPYTAFSGDTSGATRAVEYEIARGTIERHLVTGFGVASNGDGLFQAFGYDWIASTDLGVMGVWFDFGIIGLLLFIYCTFISCSYRFRDDLDTSTNWAVFLTGCAMALYGCIAPGIWYGSGSYFSVMLAFYLYDQGALWRRQRKGIDRAPNLQGPSFGARSTEAPK